MEIAAMPLMRGGRPLKAWTWVGAFGPELMLCAARVHIGVLPVAWWAVWDRASGRMIERSARGSGGVDVSPTHVRVRGRAVAVDLVVGDGTPVEVVSPHGAQEIWTRKRAGTTARGTVTVHGTTRSVDLRAVVDESAGYHARHTAWRWSAGVGTAQSGAAVAWNLVDGVHDGEPSERAVWIDGGPHPVGPVAFADDLAWVAPRDGGERLTFVREAARARRENLLVIASDYEAPFGAFAGSLPVAGPLREGFGVMERHDVRW
jgi:Domain of unknown function (DUF2804), C-terminal